MRSMTRSGSASRTFRSRRTRFSKGSTSVARKRDPGRGGETVHLDPFELHRPTTVAEALRLAGEWPGKVDYLAGGTDLLPNYKMHINLKPHLISLDAVGELAGHTLGRVGAMERLGELERDPEFL